MLALPAAIRTVLADEPTPAAAAIGRAMLARCERVRTLSAQLACRVSWQGEAMASTIRLRFAREGAGAPDAKARLRLDMKVQGNELVAVVDGDRYTAWFPAERQVVRQRLPELPGRRWDNFANPVSSLLALLAPADEDRAAIERTFLPRLRALPRERLDGSELERLQGRAAFGTTVDFWLSPADHSPRLILLTQPDVPSSEQVEYRIEIEPLDRPLDDRVFRLQVPKNARDPFKELANGPAEEPRDADPRVQLKRLEARAARLPRSAGIQLQLAAVYQQLGQARRSMAALQRAVSLDPSAETYERAWQVAVEVSQWKAAMGFLRAGLERHGDRLLGIDDEEGLWLPNMAGSARMVPEMVATLTRLLPSARDPWKVRANLLGLALRANDLSAAATQWLALIQAPAGGRPFPPEQVAAILLALNEFPQRAAAWPPALAPPTLAAMRSAEHALPPDLFPSLASLYLAVDAPRDAERLVESLGDELADPFLIGDIASALARNGDGERAARLFRHVLAMAVEQEPVDYAQIQRLVSDPAGREVLAPVLRQLGNEELSQDPFAAGHWFYLAGDFKQAAVAYDAYLSGPAGSPERAAASQRFGAASLGVVSARAGGDLERVTRFAAVASDEVEFAESEMSGGQSLVGPLLDALRGTPSLSPTLAALAAAAPQPTWVWLNERGVQAEDLDGPALRRVLDRLLPTLRRSGASPGDLAGYLVGLGRPEEASRQLIASLGKDPTSLDRAQLVDVCGRLREPETLRTALRAAVRKDDHWEEGIAALSEIDRLLGDAEGAVDRLAAAAPRLKSAELYGAVAEAEWALGRRAAAIAHLREGLALNREPAALQLLLARRLVESGETAPGVAAWKKVSTGGDADVARSVYLGLRDAGQPAEGLRYLERAHRAAEKGDVEVAAALRYVLARAYVEQRQPRKALALYPSLVADLKAADFEPDAALELEATVPFGVLGRALEQAGQAAAARRAYGAAITVQSASGEECASYLRLALPEPGGPAEARQLAEDSMQDEALANAFLAVVTEAEGGAAAAPLLERFVRPGGGPCPHLTAASQFATAILARQADRDGRTEEGSRLRRWVEAMRLVDEPLPGGERGEPAEAEITRAARLFPESPCLRLLQATGRGLRGPDLEETRAGLDALLPLAAGAADCPGCVTSLERLSATAGPVLREWFAAHAADARAYLLAAAASGNQATGSPLAAVQAEPYLRKAVALDPHLAAAWEQLVAVYELMPRESTRQLEAARQVAALRPVDAAAQLLLARAAAQAGRSAEAEAARRRAAQIDPSLVSAADVDLRAWSEARRGDDPLPQMLSFLDQRGSMTLRWLIASLPGLPVPAAGAGP
jgi:tetratricopeptide (TPR) repeat protein